MSSTPTPYRPTLVSPSGPPNGRTAAHEQLHRSEARLSAPSSIPFSSTFKESVLYSRLTSTAIAERDIEPASHPFDLHHIRLGHVTEQLESSEASVLGRDTYGALVLRLHTPVIAPTILIASGFWLTSTDEMLCHCLKSRLVVRWRKEEWSFTVRYELALRALPNISNCSVHAVWRGEWERDGFASNLGVGGETMGGVTYRRVRSPAVRVLAPRRPSIGGPSDISMRLSVPWEMEGEKRVDWRGGEEVVVDCVVRCVGDSGREAYVELVGSVPGGGRAPLEGRNVLN
ncbi:hypothetical protein DFP72DRAFT_856825 [Ephemerocybe angulata]|uniref:Uncharacterized protein n=1 Tax=Ephemerocybe angulata TaxID=980116 RepID=A0A8H6HDM3_9AGAR|nr:hypothetical protein DFP72DRAFT_856825 [Tulosesus angulatus]